MDRFLCMMRPLMLGLSVALTSSLTPAVNELELHSCLTEEKTLRMDCMFVRSNSTGQLYCEFQRNGQLLGSTDPGAKLVPEVENRVSVTLHEPNLCRLTITNMTEKASTYSCRVHQSDWQDKSMAFHMKTLPSCSNASFAPQGMPSLLLTMMTLPVLLGCFTAY